MSDEADKAWYAWLLGKNHRSYRQAFDAGRASRDAEVATVERENEALWDNLNERDKELSDMTARAEAAEAVIAAVYGDMHLMQMTSDPNDSGAYVLGRTAESAILAAAPQTVLAERDRKNREAAWEEGFEFNMQLWEDGSYAVPVNPYTEKEQSNGN